MSRDDYEPGACVPGTSEPPNAIISCPKCGYEGSINIVVHGRLYPDEDERYWLGSCPTCRLHLDSRTLDECATCGGFGQKLYADDLCADCLHERIMSSMTPEQQRTMDQLSETRGMDRLCADLNGGARLPTAPP